MDKKWVPGTGKYKLDYNWKNNPDFVHSKMGLGLTTDRKTLLGEIFYKCEKPENTSPGPAAYENHEVKL